MSRYVMPKYTLLDFDWTSKLVSATDCTPASHTPLIQLRLFCEERPADEPLVFEFTLNESRCNQVVRGKSVTMYNLPPGYIFRSTLRITIPGALLFIGYETYNGNEKFYHKYLMPLVHKVLEPEFAHCVAVKMAKHELLTRFPSNIQEFPELKCSVLGWSLDNPIGLAAGFDKNGEAIEGLQRIGFGFIEVGSVTPKPQPGNSKPRLFRLSECEAVINSYGFNSDGVEAVQKQIADIRHSSSNILGVNLGKNKLTTEASADYEIGAIMMAPHCDYLVVNVSSPNTPGLRHLQSSEELVKILKVVNKALVKLKEARPKLLLKISPDLSAEERSAIAKISIDRTFGVDGLIISNTTVSRPDVKGEEFCELAGGLSGRPLRELSTKCISEMYSLTNGKIPIIGCGGISSGSDAYEKIRAGASLVQLYTALVYQGFPVVGKVKRELTSLIHRDGFLSVSEAVGADHRE